MVKAEVECDGLLRFLDRAPGDVVKITKKSWSAAGRIVSNQLKKEIDPRFNKLCKAKVGMTRDGKVSGAVGLFKGKGQYNGNQPEKGSKVDDWFKYYWKEYGTLDNRDPGHHFDRKRKSVSKEWKGGIQPAHEFESARARAKATLFREFENQFQKNFKTLTK